MQMDQMVELVAMMCAGHQGVCGEHCGHWMRQDGADERGYQTKAGSWLLSLGQVSGCSHAPRSYLALTPATGADPNCSTLSAGRHHQCMGVVVAGAGLLADRGLGATVGGARQEHSDMAETRFLPTGASRPTGPFKVHEFVH